MGSESIAHEAEGGGIVGFYYKTIIVLVKSN